MGHVHSGMPGVYGHTLDGDMDMVPQLLESVFDARLKRGEEIYLKKFCKNPLPSDSTSCTPLRECANRIKLEMSEANSTCL